MKKINSSLFALSTLTLAMQAGAAGFALNESSAAAAGTAYAGRGSNAEDASIMAANPAGIALLEERQVTLGGALVVPKGNFEGTGVDPFSPTGTVSSKNDDFLKTKFIPFGFFSMPVDEQLSFGLGVYAPFGSSSDYGDEWAGKYMADKTEFTVVNIQPTVAYQFSDDLSVGLGVFASHGEGELTREVVLPGPALGSSKMTGDGWAYGWNIGVIWQPVEQTTLGLSYRSKVDHSLEGDAQITVKTFSAQFEEKAKLDITFPEQFELSATHQIDNRWTVMAGAVWTRWSSFDALVIESNQGGNGPISGRDPSDTDVLTYVPEKWEDVWAFSVGASYQYSDDLTLKAGYAFDQSPVPDEYRTARTPDSDRNWLTVGAKYEFGNDWTVDAAYGYMFGSKVNIGEKNYNSDGTPNGGLTLKGEYDNSAHVFSASVTKRF
ncbi:OmpP1/FadL family transporter [Endozoicomonas sp. SCSIO W0465]|uniref:OmpP1/FadL family transporter n=1 Tax=Endozoicomonas sp. SCSIO W0465 TaxID=2918516 RepID=UPI002075DD86|nr:porin [Endozoicomonas sp. SCSIO W0465]USE38869.1 outer membrane protein transport protein [Endozoicomonas sp. SCSIO W0465]